MIAWCGGVSLSIAAKNGNKFDNNKTVYGDFIKYLICIWQTNPHIILVKQIVKCQFKINI